MTKYIIPALLIVIETFFYVFGMGDAANASFYKSAFTFFLPVAAIGIISVIYFNNNPVGHKRDFRIRSYANWMPLGLTYASLYMGRYNLTVASTFFHKHIMPDGTALMSKEAFGTIFGVGAVVYGLSFIVNGPLTDRMGGKRAIIIGAVGAALANIALGFVTYNALHAEAGKNVSIFTPFIVLYGINMYFQSFGAVSIVKVNASWFHIKERGVFGGIFGTLISLGIFLAFDLNGRILAITKDVGPNGEAHTWWVFFVPAVVLLIWVVIDIFLVKDRPSQAGFADFNTGDAGAADTRQTAPDSALVLYKRLFTHPVILIMIAIEFCSGVLRNGIMHWGPHYAAEVGVKSSDFFFHNWGLILMIAGISGGFFGGFVSDKFFGSRRGPSAFFLYAGMFVGFTTMIFAVRFEWNHLLGFLAFFLSLCVIGVHGMLSGTASMDFGGKKGAATAAGVIDGFVYLGTGFQSITLGNVITNYGWNWWPIFLVPFTLIGLFFTWRIWNAFPDAGSGKGAH